MTAPENVADTVGTRVNMLPRGPRAHGGRTSGTAKSASGAATFIADVALITAAGALDPLFVPGIVPTLPGPVEVCDDPPTQPVSTAAPSPSEPRP